MNTHILMSCAVAAGGAALAICLLYPVAKPLGLIDRPDERKRHLGNVPLVGGLAILIGVLMGAVYYQDFNVFGWGLLGTAASLAVLGGLDDRYGLSVGARIAVQLCATLVMMGLSGVHIQQVGRIFDADMNIGFIGFPITLFSVIGFINAFNMMDGVDGVAGCLALVSVLAILFFDGQAGVHSPEVLLLLLLACATLPYLASNLGMLRWKIFLGDAGSVVIGYVLAWVIIHLSQDSQSPLSPANALWCVALPVFDTTAVTVRRLLEGSSPVKPDRGHLHHILIQSGLSHRQTLIAIVLMALGLAGVGYLARDIDAGINLLIYAGLLMLYVSAVCLAWCGLPPGGMIKNTNEIKSYN
jgi:UDP-GlcNAc:undecaprenyl-phosphate GlcNAc-1-phosphate transferase